MGLRTFGLIIQRLVLMKQRRESLLADVENNQQPLQPQHDTPIVGDSDDAANVLNDLSLPNYEEAAARIDQFVDDERTTIENEWRLFMDGLDEAQIGEQDQYTTSANLANPKEPEPVLDIENPLPVTQADGNPDKPKDVEVQNLSTGDSDVADLDLGPQTPPNPPRNLTEDGLQDPTLPSDGPADPNSAPYEESSKFGDWLPNQDPHGTTNKHLDTRPSPPRAPQANMIRTISNVPPRVPENAMGTLTSNDHNFAHTSNPAIIRHRYCAVATMDYLKPFGPVNYIRNVAFSPDSLRAFFSSEIISIHCSTTIKFLLLVAQI